MADTEEYFPRGGKKPAAPRFKQTLNFLGAPDAGEKKKKKPKKKSENDDGYLSDDGAKDLATSVQNCTYGISYKTIKPGTLILGRVRHVIETKVNVVLPCRMTGSVMACHISEAYNKLLEDYVNDKIEKVRELPEMFRPGQYVALKTLEVEADRLMLSMMPHHVNGGKTLADLHNGCVLQVAVHSVEDHGYVMEIGIPNTRAFLPNKHANPDIQLDTGSVTWCAVKSVSQSSDSSIITLTGELSALQAAVLRKRQASPLLPGTAVDFTVDRPLENGIEGRIFGETTAYIQQSHVDPTKAKKPALGQKVRARVLYVLPTRNAPFLTLRDIFQLTFPDMAEEQLFQEGDIIEDAQVVKIVGRSIRFKLVKGKGRSSIGTMSLKRIQIHEELSDQEVVAKSYPLGSKHKVRVLCYNLSDYNYNVTDEPAVLNERYFNLSHITAGEIVPATVRSVTDSSVVLNVGRLTGYVPQAHLFDSGVFIDPKKASTSKLTKTKYKVGQELKARVLSVDPSKQSLILTLKKSLLSSKVEALLTYHQAQVGKAYTGVIRHIRDFVIVSFFNNVAAYVKRQHVTKEPLEHLSDAFHVGQIVTCTILSVDAEGKRMLGSLITPPFTPTERKTGEKRKQETEPECTPKKKAKSKEEMDVDHTNKSKRDKRKGAEEFDYSNENEVEEIDINSGIKSKRDKKKQIQEDNSISEDSDSGLNEETEIEHTKKSKKDKKKRVEEVDESSSKKKHKDNETDIVTIKKSKKDKTNEVTESDSASKKKKDKSKTQVISEETEEVNSQDRKKKRDQKISEEVKVSEESDAIEADMQEQELLTPQEQGMVDIEDCVTAKQCKRRVVVLLKAVKNRMRRMDTIDKKIQRIEEKGLNPGNKKYHTAMHVEKLGLQERITKLMDALKSVQEKLKGFGEETKEFEYKKDKKKKSEDNAKTQVDKEDNEDDEESTIKEIESPKKRNVKRIDIKVVDSLEPALEVPSAKDFWTASAADLEKNEKEEPSSSSDDEEQEQPKKKRKKLTVAEKVAKAREEEERLREMERRAIESEAQPRSSEQFERALLASPDCSQLWIAYMAFHLQATEIEKARAVGRKALNTISFREEQERLNVWLAMLNVEHRFGTKESQEKLLKEALQMNDPFTIHSKLADILVETGKQQELTSLVDTMSRKYKRHPPMYLSAGRACYKLGLVEKARNLMQKAVGLLEKKEHVSIIEQFALMENQHGEVERSEALFEQILATYKNRVDVCAVYVDTLVKRRDVDKVRQVMERITSNKLPYRKMEFLLNKWIEAEQRIGDSEHADQVRQRKENIKADE